MLTGIEHKSGQKLATFNPYEILELPEAGRNDDGKPVSMSQIKAVSHVQLDIWNIVISAAQSSVWFAVFDSLTANLV